MSTYTYKLKGARWLRMWTAADRSSVYAAQSEAQKIADTLCDVPWTRAKSDGPAMFPLTAAKSLDENPANRDLFDAALFCADHSDGAHRAYANAAMYLFELPTTTGVHLNSVKVHVESDAYNALGARIAVHLLSSAELPTDCATVRTGAAHAEGVAARRTVERDGRNYWYSNSADVTIAGGTSESPAAIGDLKQYLAVFVGLENYATSRNEWLEGASYIRNLIEIETDAVVTGWRDGGTYDCSDAGTAVLLSGGSSPTWLQPLPTVNVGATPPALPADPVIENFFTGQMSTSEDLALDTIVSSAGVRIHSVGPTITGVDVYDGRGDQWISCTNVSGNKWESGTYGQDSSVAPSAYKMDVYCSLTMKSAENALIKYTCYQYAYVTSWRQIQSVSSDDSAPQNLKRVRAVDDYYVMLRLSDGVPVLADFCSQPDVAGRRYMESSVTETTTDSWTVVVGSSSFTVEKSGSAVSMSDGSNSWAWTSIYGGVTTFFDPSVAVRIPGETSNGAVAQYGLAASVGDFSAAVATFEAGTQPPDAEVLGRLARMSRAATGGMLYLHPASAALADELDALRPVPRFFRTDSEPPEQTACQPGLSVWYRRPAASAAAVAFAYRDATVAVTEVTSPAFLQLALLALRAPSAFASRIVLGNVGQAAVHNGFVLRFVAWRCPAEQWDGSNGFAMAAMAAMPSVYRSDGPSEVSWAVDCTGALLRFGVRNMTAERVGVSQTVTGNIAANAQIAIPLVAPVGAGDVVLIAPEVLGFADGTGAASVHFGRQEDPAGSGEDSAASHNYAWARYPENLGWFPCVIGE